MATGFRFKNFGIQQNTEKFVQQWFPKSELSELVWQGIDVSDVDLYEKSSAAGLIDISVS